MAAEPLQEIKRWQVVYIRTPFRCRVWQIKAGRQQFVELRYKSPSKWAVGRVVFLKRPSSAVMDVLPYLNRHSVTMLQMAFPPPARCWINLVDTSLFGSPA